MKTDSCSESNTAKMQQLRKLAKKRAKYTSAQLIIFAFVFIMAFGAIMRIIND